MLIVHLFGSTTLLLDVQTHIQMLFQLDTGLTCTCNWGRLVGHGVDPPVLEDLLQETVAGTVIMASCILDDQTACHIANWSASRRTIGIKEYW